ncbi:MAG: sugar ABC transporter permease [Clostridia bacterium]|nr:sugar ABC transporter permease [Clostridia bacterium]
MKKSLKDFTRKKQMYGRMFILPWEIGFVLFFLQPLVQSLVFVFSNVTVNFDEGVFETKWVGLSNIRHFFYEDTVYVDNLVDSLTSFIYTIPLIVALSLIVGVLLNQKFKGRIVFRSIFFLPVIIATGVVMTYLQGDATAQAMRSGSSSGNGIDISNILMSMNLSENVSSTLLGFVNQIFDLFWDCGVQIVLFISGLQSIPEQLYEVCRVEGANKWEEFWYVTFPMLSGTTLLVIVFTAIEIFTDSGNKVMTYGFNAMRQNMWWEGPTMLWVYFALVGAILGLAVLLIQKKIFAKWAN